MINLAETFRLCIWLGLLILVSNCFGQKLGEPQTRDWNRIEIRNLSFIVPDDVRQQEIKCIESGCYYFKNGEFSLGIDINADAYRPTYERGYSSYSEKRVWLDEKSGIYVWIWSFKRPDGDDPYRAGALFLFHDCPTRIVNMTFSSSLPGVAKVAEKIMMSVKFGTSFNRKCP
jgi:hypothetical protein